MATEEDAVKELSDLRATHDQLARDHQALLINHHEQAVQLHESRTFVAAILGLDDADSWVHRPPLPAPPQLAPVLQAVIREYWRARDKHGDKCIDGAGYSQEQRLAIVMEELGEVAHELTYDASGDESEWAERLWAELIQTATMVVAWGGWMHRQYGTVIGPETDAEGLEVTTSDGGARVVARRAAGLPAVPSAFPDDVASLRDDAPPICPRPSRGPDIVGRDLEGRYWSLWHNEGLKCYLPSKGAVDRDLAAAGHPSLVNLTRVDLAQYGDAGGVNDGRE